MLKKMQRRFISAAMAAFTAVILVLFCVVNAGNYRGVAAQQDGMLAQLFAQSERGAPNGGDTQPGRSGREPGASLADGVPVPHIGGGKDFSSEVPYMLRYFSVRYAPDGTLAQIDQDFIASISRDEAEAYAADVLALSRQHGYYKGYRYLVAASDGGEHVRAERFADDNRVGERIEKLKEVPAEHRQRIPQQQTERTAFRQLSFHAENFF